MGGKDTGAKKQNIDTGAKKQNTSNTNGGKNEDSKDPQPGSTLKATASALKATASAWNPGSGGNTAPPPSITGAASAPAWGNKGSSTVRSAPGAGHHNRGQQGGGKKKGGGGPHQGGGGQHQGGGHHQGGGGHHHDNGNNNKGNRRRTGGKGHNDQWRQQNNPKTLPPIDLLTQNDGDVARFSSDDLLAMRLLFLTKPIQWDDEADTEVIKPPPIVRWEDDSREMEIRDSATTPRMMGDIQINQEKKKNDNKNNNNNKNKGRHNDNDTAPPLEDCAPIQRNEDTRWKAKVFTQDGKDETKDENVAESNEEILRKALLVMNKLSLTKFEKLSDAFIATGIASNEVVLGMAIDQIVKKAQREPHFSAMYAALCLKIAQTPMPALCEESHKKGKKFKKMLLSRCQDEFEEETSVKIERATVDITDPEEKLYIAGIMKKDYLGHLRFIGEMYKADLLKVRIMIRCLPILLDSSNPKSAEGDDKTPTEGEIDEEKVACFTKLMTTIGANLEEHAIALKNSGQYDVSDELDKCWDRVEMIAGIGKKKKKKGPNASQRSKFMLQDLCEMRDKGWVTRRKEETAKTIAQIHKEVAKEERIKRSTSAGNLHKQNRFPSNGNMRQMNRAATTGTTVPKKVAEVDDDGFTTIAGGGGKNISRSMSMGNVGIGRSNQNSGGRRKPGSGNLQEQDSGYMKRNNSGGSFAALNNSSNQKSPKNSRRKSSGKSTRPDFPSSSVSSPTLMEDAPPLTKEEPVVVHKTPQECAESSKNTIKEFFVGGDLDDAVLSIRELVGPKDSEEEGGSVITEDNTNLNRGAKVVEAGILHVLEMKKADVDKFMVLMKRCINDAILRTTHFSRGMNDPLEFLNDISIDAPLAIPLLVGIVAELVAMKVLQLEFLLNGPAYFLNDSNAAKFAAKVMKQLTVDGFGGSPKSLEEVKSAHLDIIERLMTDDDRSRFSSPEELFNSL
eukprot:CAMPEP_0194355702 /NCGR_PEP_ID=MMETSP0174-20130528/3572_1 /TAXON_ID=216777 /ORGANISM="Proboscia alata, Strain PI-D3" /LENGTH=957 /DNA_ID=CAMNT_0039125077 /DNA_START=111 /DNA_END=2984 /DNA_ORIENTATION=+